MEGDRLEQVEMFQPDIDLCLIRGRALTNMEFYRNNHTKFNPEYLSILRNTAQRNKNLIACGFPFHSLRKLKGIVFKM